MTAPATQIDSRGQGVAISLRNRAEVDDRLAAGHGAGDLANFAESRFHESNHARRSSSGGSLLIGAEHLAAMFEQVFDHRLTNPARAACNENTHCSAISAIQ